MLQSLISLDMSQLTLTNILIVLISATLLGLIFAGVFVLTHKNTVYDRAFTTTLVMMPVVISVIIMLVSNNLARAFSLAGVFTLVRFRTAIADSRDIAYILGSVGIGLSAALGYIAFALVITVFLAVVLIGLSLLSKNQDVTNHARLRIIIPENLNCANVASMISSKTSWTHGLASNVSRQPRFWNALRADYVVHIRRTSIKAVRLIA